MIKIDHPARWRLENGGLALGVGVRQRAYFVPANTTRCCAS